MDIGWIKLHRKLKDWEWYDDKNARLLLIHLLLSVNYEDKMWKGILIKAGSLAYSNANLAKEVGLSIQQLRTSLTKLESSNVVTRKSTNKYQVVTLCNWEKLQNSNGEVTTKPTTKEQSNNNQITTTKEVKKERSKEKRKKILMSEIKISDVEEKNLPYFEISKSFYELFRNNLLEAGSSTVTLEKANSNEYLNNFRLIDEKKEASKEQLIIVYNFLKKSDFWKKNILSAKKLREKLPQLLMHANKSKVNNNEYPNGRRIAI